MKINTIPKSMTIIDNQIVSEMTDLRIRPLENNSVTILEDILQDRPDDFNGYRSIKGIENLSREKLWKLIWYYLRQGHLIDGMNSERTDILLNPLYFINSKITKSNIKTLSQSVIEECIRSRPMDC